MVLVVQCFLCCPAFVLLSFSISEKGRARALGPPTHPASQSRSRNQKPPSPLPLPWQSSDGRERPLSLFRCQATLTHFSFPRRREGSCGPGYRPEQGLLGLSCCHTSQSLSVSGSQISPRTSCLLSFYLLSKVQSLVRDSSSWPQLPLMCPLGSSPGTVPSPRARTWSPLCNCGQDYLLAALETLGCVWRRLRGLAEDMGLQGVQEPEWFVL